MRRLINTTKNTVLAENVIVAKSIFARMKGLLGKRRLQENHAVMLVPCKSIHTCFMQFTIDVVFVDNKNTVVKALSNVKPFRLSPLVFNASFAIELPAGVIKATNTAESDTILLEI